MVEGEVDELLADAWPAVETELVGRWRMRWSGGVTRRANSVLAVDGAGAIEERIARVDAFYAAHNVPPRYLVSSAAAPPGLSALLSRRGYRSIAPTFVQCAPAATVVELTSVPAGLRVESASSASDEWFSVFASTERYATGFGLRILRDVLLAPALPATFVSVRRAGHVVGVGQLVVEGTRASVQCMTTRPDTRGGGVARGVLHRLACEGLAAGVSELWLAVMVDNEPARRLYARAGFTTSHEYSYYEPTA